MIPEKYISKVSIGFLINKIGTHLVTGFNEDLSITVEATNKRIDSLDFSPDSETRMQVFERLGPPLYNSNEEMQKTFDQGVSCSRYINNSLGEKLAKEKCLDHFLSYVSNTISTNKRKLENIKGVLPVFMLSKNNKDRFKRLSKKIEIMDAINSGNHDIIKKYSLVKDVVRLNSDKEISVIKPLNENKEFFFVDKQNIVIESVFPVMADFRDFFVYDDNIDGYIEYYFVDKNGNFKHNLSMKNVDFYEKGIIKINTYSFIFSKKEDAILFLTEEKERLEKAFKKVL